MGCLVVVVGFVVIIALAINEGGKLEEAEKANPTCVTEFKLCKDNAELIERHRPVNGIKLSIECLEAAKSAARYGEPDISIVRAR